MFEDGFELKEETNFSMIFINGDRKIEIKLKF